MKKFNTFFEINNFLTIKKISSIALLSLILVATPVFSGPFDDDICVTESTRVSTTNVDARLAVAQKSQTAKKKATKVTNQPRTSTSVNGTYNTLLNIIKKYCDKNIKYKLGSGHYNYQTGDQNTMVNNYGNGYIDCSGFVRNVIDKLSSAAGVKSSVSKDKLVAVRGGNDINSTGFMNSNFTTQVAKKSEFPPTNPRNKIQVGDIFVMSGSPGHVGIFMGYNSAGQPLIAHSCGAVASKARGHVYGKIGTTGVRIEVLPSNYRNRWQGMYRFNNMNQIKAKLG